LQVTTFHDYRAANGAAVRSFRPDGIELGLGERGRVALRIGGQDLSGQKQRLGPGGSTMTIVTIAVVVVAAVVLIPVLTADELPSLRFFGDDPE
jgi:hypothetical protein